MMALFVLALLMSVANVSNQNASDAPRWFTEIPTTDGTPIGIPYSSPDISNHVAEKAAHFTSSTPETPAYQSAIRIGSKAIIPDWQWVQNINSIRQRFSNGTYILQAGETCGVEFGGFITVVGIRSGNNLLVEYTAPGNPEGTPCPSGTRFIISRPEFMNMTRQYVAIRDATLAEKALVRQLLAQNYFDAPKDAGGWRWVRVVNLNPIRQEFSNGYGYLSYGDDCGIGRTNNGVADEGGTIRVRGRANGKTLYEYTARGNPMGTAAPSGVLFLEEQPRRRSR